MADMPDRNDRISIIQCTRCGNTLLSSMFCTICGNGANVVSTEYLRSTPERERAKDMLAMLHWLSTLAKMGELSLMTYASPYTDGAIDQAVALNKLIASITAEEETPNG